MPRAKITRDMIVDAAFEIARAGGVEAVNARTISQRLGCSTQPVLYHFPTIREIKKAASATADRCHPAYLMTAEKSERNPRLAIGLNYIRFAREEPQLFRFLFQSGFISENSLPEMIDSPELVPLLAAMRQALGMGEAQTKSVFLTVALFVHGYASMLVNNALQYDEDLAAVQLEQAFRGAALAAKEETP